MSGDASTRRAARAHWTIAIQREGDPPRADVEDDDLYWLQVPQDERAQLTWDLSRELYSIALRNQGVFDEETGAFPPSSAEHDLERRLPRAAFLVTRR